MKGKKYSKQLDTESEGRAEPVGRNRNPRNRPEQKVARDRDGGEMASPPLRAGRGL